MPAVSPTNLANWNSNEYYKTDEEFRVAFADALHDEYQAIVDAGLILQIDDPQLASHWAMHPEIDLAQCRKWASASVELLNHALARHSRPSASVTTPATASIWVRASTTSN